MLFTVTARDAEGVTRTFSREAESRSALALALRAERWLVLDVKEESAAGPVLPPSWHPSWLRPVSGFDVEMGLRELAAMLRSGITLLKGLRSVAEQAPSPRAKRMWMCVADCVLGGSSFAAALEEQPRHFGEIVVRLSEVGERSGELEHTVSRAASASGRKSSKIPMRPLRPRPEHAAQPFPRHSAQSLRTSLCAIESRRVADMRWLARPMFLRRVTAPTALFV